MKTLDEILSRLSASVGNPAMLSLINTRLILRTGVDLKDIKPGQNESREAIARVLEELKAMGFPLTPPQASASSAETNPRARP